MQLLSQEDYQAQTLPTYTSLKYHLKDLWIWWLLLCCLCQFHCLLLDIFNCYLNGSQHNLHKNTNFLA